VGRRLRIGAVELAVSRTPKHCLGVYAEVRLPGEIRVGDRVQLLP
jgi:MOSC domain-containing protein YiiM